MTDKQRLKNVFLNVLDIVKSGRTDYTTTTIIIAAETEAAGRIVAALLIQDKSIYYERR